MNIKEKVEINGKALKEARERKGLKQENLAKAIFSTRQSISNWENGKKIPTLENVKRLAEVLEIPIEELIANNKETENVDSVLNKTVEFRNIEYALTCIEKESIFNKLNFKKIMLILGITMLLVFLIYICSSIRKIIILIDINNKRKELINVNNYFYTIITTEYENDIIINNYKEEGYFIDNNLKLETSNLDGTKYVEYFLEDEYFYIDLEEKNYFLRKLYRNNNKLVIVNNALDMAEIFKYTINLNFKIINSEYYYYVFYECYINEEKNNVVDKINKITGQIEVREVKHGKFKTQNEYYIEKNTIQSSDLELIDLESFSKKESLEEAY